MASGNLHCGPKTLHEQSDIKIIINEEYASLVPKISESEYETIKLSIKHNGQHVPIIINQKGEILDGHTRLKACKELGITPRTMMREEFEDPLLEKRFIIDINRNRRHLNPFQRIELQYKAEVIESELAKRRQLSTLPEKGQKGFQSVSSKNLPHTKEHGKGRVLDISATKAHVSSETYRKGRELIGKSSPEILEKLRTEEIKIDKAYGDNRKQEKLDLVHSITDPQTDLEIMGKLGITIRPFDFWSISSLDERFGLKYPGNQPADIIFNTLYFFTQQGDLVVDPMAGGGVVGDVCNVMKRRCKMLDINPIRHDIQKWDIRNGLPPVMEKEEVIDLLFLDPPYYKKIDYGPNSISVLTKKDFLKVFSRLAKNLAEIGVKKVGLLVSSYDDEYNGNPQENIFVWDYVNIFVDASWRALREIQVPLTTQQIIAPLVAKYREERKLHRLSRSLIIFERVSDDSEPQKMGVIV